MYEGNLARDVPGASINRKSDEDVEEDIDVDEGDEEFGDNQFEESTLEAYRSSEQGIILTPFIIPPQSKKKSSILVMKRRSKKKRN
jgi:hypothetical protein